MANTQIYKRNAIFLIFNLFGLLLTTSSAQNLEAVNSNTLSNSKKNKVTITSVKSEDFVVIEKSKYNCKFTKADDVFNLLNNTVELAVNLNNSNPDNSADVTRVKVCVSGHWPLNGCYEFGSDRLECGDLLGENEHFPNGVTCSNI